MLGNALLAVYFGVLAMGTNAVPVTSENFEGPRYVDHTQLETSTLRRFISELSSPLPGAANSGPWTIEFFRNANCANFTRRIEGTSSQCVAVNEDETWWHW